MPNKASLERLKNEPCAQCKRPGSVRAKKSTICSDCRKLDARRSWERRKEKLGPEAYEEFLKNKREARTVAIERDKEKPCSKCGSEPRMAGRVWGLSCHNEYSRRRRERVRVTRALLRESRKLQMPEPAPKKPETYCGICGESDRILGNTPKPYTIKGHTELLCRRCSAAIEALSDQALMVRIKDFFAFIRAQGNPKVTHASR